MARAFESVIRLQLDRYSPEEARRRHIAIARAGLADFLGKQSVAPAVEIETDGRKAASEASVKPYGVIVYRFLRMREIVEFALNEARKLSPKLTGRYRDAWFPMIDEKAVAVSAIPPTAEVIITNDQPYSRKINVGAKGYEKYVPPGIAEKVRMLVERRFGALVTVKVEFITLDGGWKLQNNQYRTNSRGERTNRVRSDAKKGDQITYPSIRITPKRFA